MNNIRRRKVLVCLATATILAVVTLMLDYSAAQVCKRYCDFIFRREHRLKYRVPHQVYHHDFLPNVAVMGKWGKFRYQVYTNSLGFKDKTIREVPLKSDRYRLLFIGDSFTEGQGLAYEKTFVGRVDKDLASRGVAVLNAAVSSYAPAVYFAKVKHLVETVGLKIDHLVVVIDMSDIFDEAFWYAVDAQGVVHAQNEEEEVVLRRAFGKSPLDWFKDNSLIVTLAYRLRDSVVYYSLRAKARKADSQKGGTAGNVDFWMERVADTRETDWCFDDDAYDEWGKRGVERAMHNMDRLLKLLKEHRSRLTVAVYPWPANILRGDYPSRCSEVWRAWADSRGVNFLDLFPLFIGNGDPRQVIVDNFFFNDIHWNERGHDRVARLFLDYLEEYISPKVNH